MCNADPAFISRRFGAFGDYLRRENVMKKRALFIIALSILAIATMFISGIVAQIIINSRAWQAAGSNYSTPPSLPVIQLEAIIKALLTFPEGLMAIGTVLGAVVLLCVFGLRLGWGKRGTSDQDRNLTISYDGTYGTAGFMTEQEAGACFTVGSPRQTCEDILGMLSDGSVFSLPSDTRLNHNIAVYGASGTGKSRSMSRNSILQAVCRGDSIVVTDPKSELYESMSEYLRNQGYTVKVLNLIQLEHSDSWNCLAEVKDELMAQTFADVVLRATSGEESDAFWYNAELNLLKALVLYAGQIIKLSQYDKSAVLGVTIKKVGNREVQPGQSMRYDFSGIANTSNVALNSFYWHDRFPTDATRAVSMTTGTYNSRLYYRVTYKTNYADYRVLASNLLTTNNYAISLAASSLGLRTGEYVTDIRLEFGSVPSGFVNKFKPTLTVQTLGSLSNGYQIINRADVGGKYLSEWETARTNWVTRVWRINTPAKLPKTGY